MHQQGQVWRHCIALEYKRQTTDFFLIKFRLPQVGSAIQAVVVASFHNSIMAHGHRVPEASQRHILSRAFSILDS